MMRRRGRPVARTVGRAAVVGGTAAVVSGGVSRRQSRKYAAEQQDAAAAQDAAYAQGQADAQATAPPPAAAAPAGDDMMTQLAKLGELREQGVLTEAEFEAQKAKILAS